MRWWRRRRAAQREADARLAAELRARAAEQLKEEIAAAPERRRVADSHRRLGAHNGFSEAMERLYGEPA